MTNFTALMKLLSDPTRVRILMVISQKELCVCQIMGVLGISQPLVSRNLGLIRRAGFLDERKDGKLVFYSVSAELPGLHERLIRLLKDILKSDKILSDDLKNLKDCEKFQKKAGKCDMKTLSAFMSRKRAARSGFAS